MRSGLTTCCNGQGEETHGRRERKRGHTATVAGSWRRAQPALRHVPVLQKGRQREASLRGCGAALPTFALLGGALLRGGLDAGGGCGRGARVRAFAAARAAAEGKGDAGAARVSDITRRRFGGCGGAGAAGAEGCVQVRLRERRAEGAATRLAGAGAAAAPAEAAVRRNTRAAEGAAVEAARRWRARARGDKS